MGRWTSQRVQRTNRALRNWRRDMSKRIAGAGASEGRVIKMAPKIAYRNLFHDRMSLIVTLVGIVFSVVLVAIEVGLYKGSESKIATVLDKAPADLWIVPFGTK